MTEWVFLAFFRPETREKNDPVSSFERWPQAWSDGEGQGINPLTIEAGNDSFRMRDKELRR